MTARTNRLVAAATLLLGLWASACGVPVDDSPTVTPDDEVPYDLLSSTTTALPADVPRLTDTTICLSLDGSLLAIGRARDGEPALDTLEALASASPTEGERTVGLRSAVAGDDVLDGVALSDGRAEVSLGEGFTELPADEQLLAVAQLTCTLTAQPGVGSVRFELDGERTEVPVQGGELVARAVTREDYARLIAN